MQAEPTIRQRIVALAAMATTVAAVVAVTHLGGSKPPSSPAVATVAAPVVTAPVVTTPTWSNQAPTPAATEAAEPTAAPTPEPHEDIPGFVWDAATDTYSQDPISAEQIAENLASAATPTVAATATPAPTTTTTVVTTAAGTTTTTTGPAHTHKAYCVAAHLVRAHTVAAHVEHRSNGTVVFVRQYTVAAHMERAYCVAAN